MRKTTAESTAAPIMRPATPKRRERIFLVTAIVTAMLGAFALASASFPSSAKAASAGTSRVAVASAMTPAYSVWWLNNHSSGRCADDSSLGLRAIACNGGDYQEWNQVPKGGIIYAMQDVHTHRCLDDSAARGLRAVACNNLNYQDWGVYNSGIYNGLPHQGWWVLRNQHTGLCLDDSAAYGLRAIACNGTNHQDWQ